MSKLKKQIKKLKKLIREKNVVLAAARERRERNFTNLCTIRGKEYYRANPLHPKAIDKTCNNPSVALVGIRAAARSFQDSILNRVGKAEELIREQDRRIRNMEQWVAKKRVELEELKELSKS